MCGNSERLLGDRSERLQKALKAYGKTMEDLEQDLATMKEWFKSQPHLPEVANDKIITNILITNKFSIEKSKENMDMYYTMRSLLPEFFQNKHPKLPHMKTASETLYYVTMPNLTEEGYRVTFLQLIDYNAENFVLSDVTGHCINLYELRFRNDIMFGDVYVINLANIPLSIVSKMTPVNLKKMFSINEKIYKNLLKKIHFINVPPYVENIINFIKQIVKGKLASRIYVHKSGDDLKEYLPLSLLPKEYGGTEYSLHDLHELWLKELEVYQDRFDELEKLQVDESKRPAPLKNDEILGFHGNFRKLNVD